MGDVPCFKTLFKLAFFLLPSISASYFGKIGIWCLFGACDWHGLWWYKFPIFSNTLDRKNMGADFIS